jgi:hypothetical protein
MLSANQYSHLSSKNQLLCNPRLRISHVTQLLQGVRCNKLCNAENLMREEAVSGRIALNKDSIMHPQFESYLQQFQYAELIIILLITDYDPNPLV